MKPERIYGTPFDYSNNKLPVYFELADKQNARKSIERIPFIENIKDLEHGFEIELTIQQIPEVIRSLSQKNIAIYSVIPQKTYQ